jgi:hypothetical protein
MLHPQYCGDSEPDSGKEDLEVFNKDLCYVLLRGLESWSKDRKKNADVT